VSVRYRNAQAEAAFPLGPEWRVRLEDGLLEGLREWLPGEDAVKVVYH
jgi:DNA polymerase-3 subunit alpha